MPSAKLTALVNLAGGQVPTDLAYIVDVSAGLAGSKRSTLNDLFSIITRNITDGAVRFQGFAAPTPAASQGSIYYDSATDRLKFSENNGAYVNVGNVTGPAIATDEALARFDLATGKILQDSAITLSNAGVLTFPDNVRQTFNPGANNAGLNVGALAGDPSAPSNGDLWYDSTGNLLRARINGASISLGSSIPGGLNTQVQFNNGGAFGGVSGATSNGTAITFTANNLIATSPRLITSILDSNGNELWNLTATPSAINELNYANAAAGSSPMWTASGGDTDIGFWITPKGVGEFRVFDPANGAGYFGVRQFEAGGGFPRTLFQGGASVADSNWYMRFANAYSSSALNIPTGIQLTTNNDASYTNAHAIAILATTTIHAVFSFTAGGDGAAIIVTTNDAASSDTNPNLYLDTVANNQRIGIRTITPTAQLHIVSAANSLTGLRVNNTAGSTVPIAIFNGNSIDYVTIDSSANTYFGSGITNAAPGAYVLNATGGSGSNIAGGNLDLAGGKGTGNAVPGLVAVRYPLIGASGTTLQSLSTARFPVQTNFYLNYSTSTTVANTTTETNLLGAADQGTDTVEAGLARVGRTFLLDFRGVVANTGTPTLTLRLKLGGTTIAAYAGAMVTISGQVIWKLSILATITAIGATGSISIHASAFEYSSVATGAVQWLGSNVTSTVIDFTANQQWSLTAQWGAADPANTLTYQFGNIDIVR